MAVRFDADLEDYTSTTPVSVPYTVICWARIDVDRNAFSTIWASDTDTTSGYHILQTDTGGQTVEFNGNAGRLIGPTATVGQWYRFAVTVNAAFSVTEFYYGSATGALSLATGDVSINPASFTRFRVGDSSFAGEWLNGSVAALKHYSVVLSQAAIEAELSQYLPVRTTNLVRWYPFVNAEITDYSGNSNTLTGGSGAATTDGPPIPWGPSRAQLILPTEAGNSRSVSDSAPAVDTVTRAALTPTRSVSDAGAASDTVTRSVAASRSATDSAPAADAVARGALAPARALTDSAPAADTPSGTLALSRSVGDGAAATDTTSRGGAVARSVADSAPATDTTSRTAAAARAVSDPATAADSVTRGAQSYTRAATDTAAAVDSPARGVTTSRTVSDGAPAVGTVARVLAAQRSLADTAAAGDVVTTGAARSILDSAVAGDVVARTLTTARAPADSAVATDTITRVGSAARGASESAPAVDTVTRGALALGRDATDSATAGDTITRIWVGGRSGSDVAGAVDVASRVTVAVRLVADSAVATDTVTGGQTRSVLDGASATDGVTRLWVGGRPVTDVALAIDGVSVVVGLVAGRGQMSSLTRSVPSMTTVQRRAASMTGGER